MYCTFKFAAHKSIGERCQIHENNVSSQSLNKLPLIKQNMFTSGQSGQNGTSFSKRLSLQFTEMAIIPSSFYGTIINHKNCSEDALPKRNQDKDIYTHA